MGYLLHHAVDEWADRTPDVEVFRFEGSALSYDELRRRTDALGATLVELGVRPSDRVGIYMGKSLDLPVAIFGILKAGGVYVPIDPNSPKSRVGSIIEDCAIRILITDGARAKRVGTLSETSGLSAVIGPVSPAEFSGAGGISWIAWGEIKLVGEAPSVAGLTENDLAYLMYTSGSTGTPKGLMHTHRSGLAYVTLSAEVYGVGPGCRLGNHSPLHFDMSTFEYLTGPNRGATTVIIPEEVTMFPASLGELIGSEGLTHWYSVPLALIQLVERGCLEQGYGSTLRWVLFGGEPFPPKYLRQLMERWPDATFSNSYGPAEVNQCTFHHIPPGTDVPDEPVPLGRIWPGAEGMVVDERDDEVEPGEVGELLVRAPTMMRGYWGRPELSGGAILSSETFPGFRKQYYRTGDLVSLRPDGLLTFRGRKDRQVKVRGHRVELDEIEAVCNAFDSVVEAAALPMRDEDGAVEVIVVAQVREGSEVDPTSLRREFLSFLPSYAVPATVHVRPGFPRTGSGKIDRRALLAEYQGGENP